MPGRRLLLVLLLVIPLFTHAVEKDPIPAEVTQALSALCHLQKHNRTEGVSSGSGVVIAARNGVTYVLTAEHVVRSEPGLQIAVTLNPGRPSQRDVEGRVVCLDPVYDMALLEIGATDVQPLPVRNDAPKQNELLYMAGFPNDVPGMPSVEPTLATAPNEEGRWTLRGIGRPGVSGGAVLDASGRLVGAPIQSNWRHILSSPGTPRTIINTHERIFSMLALPVQRLSVDENSNDAGTATYTLRMPLGIHAERVLDGRSNATARRLIHGQTGLMLGRNENHAVDWPAVNTKTRIENGYALVDVSVRGNVNYSVDVELELLLAGSDGETIYEVVHRFNADLPMGNPLEPAKKKKKRRARSQ